IFRKPIVAAIHQPFLGTKSNQKLKKHLAKHLILQYDAVIFLSEVLMKDTIEILQFPKALVNEKFSTAQWGPNINCYKEMNKLRIDFDDCSYFISAGHTDRDYETLIEAFREINFPLHIYCTPTTIPKTKDIPDHVKIFSSTVPYVELLQHYKHARAILIPLKYPSHKEGCQGMTSLQDVIALAKPVVMTKNISLNLDIEKEGIGHTVEMYDVGGWRNTLLDFLTDQAGWNTMVQNTKRVYQEKFNSVIFADSLEKVFRKVYERHK